MRRFIRGVEADSVKTGRRAASYSMNRWVFFGPPQKSFYVTRDRHDEANYFTRERDLRQSALTPILTDGLTWVVGPKATDRPPANLMTGIEWNERGGPGYRERGHMSFVAIPRHGSRPSPVPEEWPGPKPLPGAINAVFFDGHAEQVPLEELWGLYWHRNYEPPEQRPMF